MTKKSIHFFVRTLNQEKGGGSHHNAISFINFLKDKGHDVVVHTLVSVGNNVPQGMALVEHQGERYGFLAAQNFLVSLLRQYEKNVDVYFLYGVDFSWGGGKYRREGGLTPVVVYLDTYLASMNLGEGEGRLYYLKRILWDKIVGLRYVQWVDRFLAVSPFLQEQYIRAGFPVGSFMVVPNFFKFPNTKPTHHNMPDTLRLLYTGRLIYDKGVDLLIRAVARLPSYPWTLTIVGDGPMKEILIRLAEALGISSRVTFLPWLDMAALDLEYSRADIFVHPARWPEPFGRTVVEVMAHGVPTIVPRNGGAAWIVDNTGILFNNNDLDSLCSALSRLVEDPILRSSLGEAAYKRAQVFSEEAVGTLLIEAIALQKSPQSKKAATF
ncbi:MAG: glycosyltransferase family 4 protein [Patescibacteria group bacterium]